MKKKIIDYYDQNKDQRETDLLIKSCEKPLSTGELLGMKPGTIISKDPLRVIKKFAFFPQKVFYSKTSTKKIRIFLDFYLQEQTFILKKAKKNNVIWAWTVVIENHAKRNYLEL